MNCATSESFAGTDRFQIVRRIGSGGMGVVYEANDRERNARVALKTLFRLDPESLYRLKQEFRALSDVSHPNLVNLHELFSVGEQWFFTMDLVPGVSFLDYLSPRHAAAGQNLTVEEVASDARATVAYDLPTRSMSDESSAEAGPRRRPLKSPEDYERLRTALAQLADGVAALHGAAKLHRDIKPSNVLVTVEGRVVLLDFGLVSDMLPRPLDPAAPREIAGTLAYMAPEQAAGLRLSAASDWYSVGVVLYEALTGRRPHIGRGAELIRLKKSCDPIPPCELAPGTPEDLNDLCLQLLRRAPDDRPAERDIRHRLASGRARSESAPIEMPKAAPFIGRTRHLDVLNQAFRDVRRGRTATVFVHGRSGAGKSLLVQRFLEELIKREDVVVLAGRCYERESVPYKALDSLVDTLSQYLGRLSWDESAAILPRDVPALARLFPVLQRVAPVAAIPPEAASVPDAQELRRRAFAALRELLAKLGQSRPLVLAIDDLQWGDTDSAALLSELLRPPAPVLMFLGSYRSEYAGTSPCLQALLQEGSKTRSAIEHTDISVEPLSPAEALELAGELLGADSPAARARAEVIARESRGIPYLVQELAQFVQEGSRLAEDGQREISLEEVLWHRVGRLPETSRRLLEIVAVAGRPLRLTDAYRAAALSTEDRAALAVLRVGRLIRGTGPGEQDEIEAYHDRIHETVTSHLSARALQEHHRSLAQTLAAVGRADPETLAIHFEGAGENDQAGHYYALAADQAAQALAFDRAAKLLRKSLEIRRLDEAARRDLQARLGDALANAGRGLEAAHAYQQAAQGAAAAVALEMQRRAAMQALISGHIDEGLAALRTVLDAAGMKLARTPGRALLSLLWRRCLLRLRGLGFKERDTTQIPADRLGRIDICWSVAVGLSIVDTIRAADFQTRNLLLSLQAGEPYRVARALAWEAAHVANLGGPAQRRTARLLEAAEALARRLNHPHAIGMAILSRGIAGYMEGRWQSGRVYSEQAETIFRDRCTGVAWELDTSHSFALWSLFFLGEVAELVRRLPALLKEARERGDLYAATNLGTFVGHLTWLAADDPDGARNDLREVMQNWSHQGFHVQHLTGLMGRLQIDLYRGDGPAAWKCITEEWPGLKRSLFLRVQVVRAFMTHLRARSALAMAAHSKRPNAMHRLALHDARALERERMPYARAMAQLVRAGVAAARGRKAQALALSSAAAAGFEAADMGLFAAAARRRQGELTGGPDGQELIRRADAWMAGQEIKNADRMAQLHAPGFD